MIKRQLNDIDTSLTVEEIKDIIDYYEDRGLKYKIKVHKEARNRDEHMAGLDEYVTISRVIKGVKYELEIVPNIHNGIPFEKERKNVIAQINWNFGFTNTSLKAQTEEANTFNAKECKEKIEKWIKETVGDCTVVIGISGGIDSSVSAALCVGALGKDKVFGVLLPDGEQHDIDMSYKVCKHLGIDYKVINIAEEVKIARENTRTLRDGKYKYFNLEAIPAEGKLFDYSETNTPSRIRMQKLYDVAAELTGCGYPSRVVNTCNLSEDFVGYSTKFGDSAGDFSPLSDLTKTEVRMLGYELLLPKDANDKEAIDGMSKKILPDGTVHYLTDEEKLGFTYDELDRYIRTGKIDNFDHKMRIDTLYKMNRHKVEPMKKFVWKDYQFDPKYQMLK